jgi:hypothetical protein
MDACVCLHDIVGFCTNGGVWGMSSLHRESSGLLDSCNNLGRPLESTLPQGLPHKPWNRVEPLPRDSTDIRDDFPRTV